MRRGLPSWTGPCPSATNPLPHPYQRTSQRILRGSTLQRWKDLRTWAMYLDHLPSCTAKLSDPQIGISLISPCHPDTKKLSTSSWILRPSVFTWRIERNGPSSNQTKSINHDPCACNAVLRNEPLHHLRSHYASLSCESYSGKLWKKENTSTISTKLLP